MLDEKKAEKWKIHFLLWQLKDRIALSLSFQRSISVLTGAWIIKTFKMAVPQEKYVKFNIEICSSILCDSVRKKSNVLISIV